MTMAALLATFDTDAVMPVGAELLVVAEEFVYQAIVPADPAAILLVVTAKEAVPAVPLVIVPDWAAIVTVAVPVTELPPYVYE